jgi:hypothetical protein
MGKIHFLLAFGAARRRCGANSEPPGKSGGRGENRAGVALSDSLVAGAASAQGAKKIHMRPARPVCDQVGAGAGLSGLRQI